MTTTAGGKPASVVARSGDASERVPVFRLFEIVVPEPHHRIPGQEIPVAVVTIGRRVETVVCDWIDERLKRERRPSLIARQLRDDSREISAAAVTADGNAIRVNTQLRRMVRNPSGDRETIVDRRRTLGLRGEAVSLQRSRGSRRDWRARDT